MNYQSLKHRSRNSGKKPARGGAGSSGAMPRSLTTSNLNNVREFWSPIFSAKTNRKLRYSTNTVLNGSSGIVSTWVYSANGLFDPDITGTGHQPMGFDQMMIIYNHYTVNAARMVCTFRNLGARACTACIRMDGNNVPITVIDEIVEEGMCTFETLEPVNVYGSNKTIILDTSIKIFQGKKSVIDDPNLGGNVAANPIEQQYFHVATWDTNAQSTSVLIDVVIEFDATFTEPRTLTESYMQMKSVVEAKESKSRECRKTFKLPEQRALLTTSSSSTNSTPGITTQVQAIAPRITSDATLIHGVDYLCVSNTCPACSRRLRTDAVTQ